MSGVVMVGSYCSKPKQIRAVQLRWANWNVVAEFLGDALIAENPSGARYIELDDVTDTCGEPGPQYIGLNVRTGQGVVTVVRHGDWIIADEEPGRFHPCTPDVFAETYQPVTD